ncbi:hypothetical protein [Luteimonas sp. MHLX1A]|uniref:hypothetical protein n=1 Tax=Alterluteimonas muca TaxID=2878684 RepID=UPI001E5D48DE|nr:hypothetical protein [Luteimonas sp. MHLX1A]MCD9046859.1 hypothetical protein [Luteimonas sp. MHLX1A]
MKQFILFGLLACLVAPTAVAREPVIDVSKPQTIDVWDMAWMTSLPRSEWNMKGILAAGVNGGPGSIASIQSAELRSP